MSEEEEAYDTFYNFKLKMNEMSQEEEEEHYTFYISN